MKLVNEHLNYPKAKLIEPNTKGYIQIAAKIDTTPFPFFLRTSKKKKQIINWLDRILTKTSNIDGVQEINSFKAVIIPPAKHEYLESVRSKIHVANFDYTILIETENVDSAKSLRKDPLIEEIVEYLNTHTKDIHISTFKNAKRINEVDKKRKGIFLFNYFYAADVNQLLPVWEYTAGWFTAETGLDNSTLLMPVDNNDSDFGVINHCRWNKLSDFMPKIMFKKSMRKYVVENFDANQIASMPMMYKVLKNYST